MGYLYLLTEDDYDDLFFQRCVERLTGQTFTIISRPYRKGGGWSEVRKTLPFMLPDIKRSGFVEDTFFVIATDNDRTPIYPNCLPRPDLSPQEAKKRSRYLEVLSLIEQVWGTNRGAWPIPGAIAVPVEMLESWLLLICGHPSQDMLPLFSRRRDTLAQTYYGIHIQPQLKDLSKAKRKALNISHKPDFYTYCVDNLDPDDLAAKSPSFALFREEVTQWGDQT